MKASSAVIVRDKDNKVFITKRSQNKKYSPNKWETIGGKVEKDESFEDCLKREIKEELNTDIRSFKYLKDYFFANCHFKFYLVELKGEPKPNKNDVSDWGWFSRDEIEKMNFAINCKERILDYFNNK